MWSEGMGGGCDEWGERMGGECDECSEGMGEGCDKCSEGWKEGVMSELEEASNNNNRQRALMEDLMMGHTVRGELEQEDQAELTGQYTNSVP